MKKIFVMFMLVMGCLAATAKSYEITGLYHDTMKSIPQNYRVITDDERIASVTMTLMPAQVREKSYDVYATRVAKNVYKIEGSTFHAELYIEVPGCDKKADNKAATMVIDNIKGSVKGKLTFK